MDARRLRATRTPTARTRTTARSPTTKVIDPRTGPTGVDRTGSVSVGGTIGATPAATVTVRVASLQIVSSFGLQTR